MHLALKVFKTGDNDLKMFSFYFRRDIIRRNCMKTSKLLKMLQKGSL